MPTNETVNFHGVEVIESVDAILRSHQERFDVVGRLGSSTIGMKSGGGSRYSDLDLFLITAGSSPSDYFTACSALCTELTCQLNDVFLFASFRQQMLLRHLARPRNPLPIHYLQYLDLAHLSDREPNDLPENLTQVLCPIKLPSNLDLNPAHVRSSIKTAPNGFQRRLFHYYFDVANELLPLYFNYLTGVIPREVIVEEVVHKIRFLARRVPWPKSMQDAPTKEDTGGSPGSSVQEEESTVALDSLSLEINALEQADPAGIDPRRLLGLLQTVYHLFDAFADSIGRNHRPISGARRRT